MIKTLFTVLNLKHSRIDFEIYFLIQIYYPMNQGVVHALVGLHILPYKTQWLWCFISVSVSSRDKLVKAKLSNSGDTINQKKLKCYHSIKVFGEMLVGYNILLISLREAGPELQRIKIIIEHGSSRGRG